MSHYKTIGGKPDLIYIPKYMRIEKKTKKTVEMSRS